MKKNPQYIIVDEYGNKFYFKDREMTIRHREDGPACEWSNGVKEWALDGRYLDEKEFNFMMSPEVILTIEEVAAKLNIPAEKLKIKK